MWKESYRIGVEHIDQQHMELFAKTKELVTAVEQGGSREEYQRIIGFLKEYVVFHFRDEEAYQAKVNYPHIKEHKQTHNNFTKTVLEHEQKLLQSDFDTVHVKDLAGMLTAWLIYHVAHTDCKIAQGGWAEAAGPEQSNLHTFRDGVVDTLQIIAGLDPAGIKEYDNVGGAHHGDVFVTIDVFGDVNGTLTYAYSKDLALNLLCSMTAMQPEGIDELVCSALAEITNISTGNATVKLSGRGIHCDIKPPRLSLDPGSADGYGGIVLESGSGILQLSAVLDTY